MTRADTDTTPTPPARRRWWRWLLAALVIVPVLLVLIVSWVFLTASGRDAVLAQAGRFLPPEALSWRAAEGRLSGGLVLHDVRYSDDGLDVALERVELDLSASALLTGDVHVRRLALQNGRVDLPPPEPDDEPWPEQIELPETLPDLALPVSVRLDALDVRNVLLTQEGESLLDVRSLTGAAGLQRGVLQLDRLSLDSDRLALDMGGRVDTAHRWNSDVQAQARVILEDVEPLPVDVRIKGDLKDMHLTAHADPGQPADLQLRVYGGLPTPDWTLRLEAAEVSPQRLGAEGDPVSLDLQGHGNLSVANLQGHVAQGDFSATLLPSQLSYRNAVVELSPLAVALLDGSAHVTGNVDLSGEVPDLALSLAWENLLLSDEADVQALKTRGTGNIVGPLEDYALTVNGVFAHGDDEARLDMEGQGSTSALTIYSLNAFLPTGKLQASGTVAWDPEVSAQFGAQLESFDPSYFVPDLPGSVTAQLALQGGIGDDGPHGTLNLLDLSGQLRGQPLSGNAQIQARRDGSGEGAAQLGLGPSRMDAQGSWGKQLDIHARLHSLVLADVLPDASGRVEAQVDLTGPRDTPQLDVHLDGQQLVYADQEVDALSLRARLDDWDRGIVSLEAQKLKLGGQDVDIVSLSGEGSRANHEAVLALDGPLGGLGLDISGGLDPSGSRWNGVLKNMNVSPADAKPWRQRDPSQLSYDIDRGQFALETTCLDASPASLCAHVTQSGAGGSSGEIDLQGLDLAELDPLLVALLEQPAAMSGELTAHATFRQEANGNLHADATVDIPRAGIRMDPEAENDVLDMTDLRLTATVTPETAELNLDAKLNKDGFIRLQASTDTPMQADGALRGELAVELDELAALELFSDQVVNASGRIDGRLAIAGTRNAPQLDGALELQEFSAELPALGINPSEGHITLSSRDAQEARINGTVRLGDGTATVDGRFDLAAEDGPVGKLTLSGENLTVMATPEAFVRASPDLQIGLEGSTLRVRGSVDVPHARIDLERLDSVDTASPDVVVVDAAQTEPGLAIDTDVSVMLGKGVQMNGYGLKGTLAGQLRVRDEPGHATTARGAIEVGGEYKAYGQDLKITRGHVSWAATPIDTPALDIRAERKIDDITVGVQVRGTALVPEMTLWSTPAMEQAEQLSYLILGRPLRSASEAEGTELTQAAAAMGGNLLAKDLGARMGLDEVGVADNRALGGAALTVGKYLSPRLHVSYGVALFGTGQVVTFKYLLSRLWNVQIDSGTENRAALNYRLER